MSDYKEHFAQLDLINFKINFKYWYRFQFDIWTTFKKKQVKLCDMSKYHIERSINLINNTTDIRVVYGLGKLWLPKLEQELERRTKVGERSINN